MLILASASPRRQELLRSAHIDFAVQPTNLPEVTEPGESPDRCAKRLAYEKALAITTLRPDALMLGADTIVVVENEMLAKPEDEQDAERMRFDVPVVGVKTIEVMHKASATCLAIDSGKCLLLDGAAVIEAADAASISIVAH